MTTARRERPEPTVPDGHPLARLEFHLRHLYRRNLTHVRPTETPGYWEGVALCDGWGHPGGHPCGQRHTYPYLDDQRGPDGRWDSCYRTWETAREHFAEQVRLSEEIVAELIAEEQRP